jgi:ribonuclease J
VHVSGHASREELKMMINLLHPRYCVPIHGEYRHMVLYREMAAEVGLMPENVIMAEIGRTVEFGREGVTIGDRVPCGSVLVDGVTVGEVGQEVLRDRLHLSRDGVLVVSVVLDRLSGQIVAGPELMSRGFTESMEGVEELIVQAKERVYHILSSATDAEVEYGFVASKLRESLGRFLYERTRRRPMILPVVTEV